VGDTPFGTSRVVHVILSCVQLDSMALRVIHTMLQYPNEVAFRLLCWLCPRDTVLRVTGEAGSTRVGEEMDVAPAEPDGHPCIFSHTHVRLDGRSYSPPSLNDIASLINDCMLGVTNVPIAAVASLEPDNRVRLYLYDCVSVPPRSLPDDPVSARDVALMTNVMDILEEEGSIESRCRSAAINAMLLALEDSNGHAFNLLHSRAMACPVHSPHSWRRRWVEYVVSAALAMDSRCGLEFPEWISKCVSHTAISDRDASLDEQFSSLEAGRRCFYQLRRWHVAVRDTEVPVTHVNSGGNSLPSTLVVRL
jgi:hypothetical protein